MTDSYNTGRGFAFVTFSSAAEVRSGVHIVVANDLQATAAIAAMDGQEVCGREIQCNLAKPKKVEGLGGGRGGGAGPESERYGMKVQMLLSFKVDGLVGTQVVLRT